MRKLYIDLAIVLICIFFIIKMPLLFLLIAIGIAIVWFFALDDKKRVDIKNKISEFYR